MSLQNSEKKGKREFKTDKLNTLNNYIKHVHPSKDFSSNSLAHNVVKP